MRPNRGSQPLKTLKKLQNLGFALALPFWKAKLRHCLNMKIKRMGLMSRRRWDTQTLLW